MTTNSVAITQYVDAISGANKRTGYEYLKRLEFFEKFISTHYHFTVDELTINKMFDINIYDLLSEYVSYLVKKTDENGHTISNATVKQRIITTKNFLEYHDIEISPRKFKLKVKIPKSVKRNKEALSKEDVVKILETCSNMKLKTFVLFLAATGARASEACSIRLMDIDFDKGRCNIRGDFTKTKEDRYVFLTDELVSQLRLWLDHNYRARRKYLPSEHKNVYLKPERKDTDLVFASSFSFDSFKSVSSKEKKQEEYKIVTRLYITLAMQFDRILDQLKIGYEDATKRRRKITFHSFRRHVKSTISDLGYSDYSEWFIGHAGSTYYRKGDKEKLALFNKISPSLTYLDQSYLERKGRDMESQFEVIRRENLELRRSQEEMRQQFTQVMEMIQENPKLAKVKPEVLVKKKTGKVSN